MHSPAQTATWLNEYPVTEKYMLSSGRFCEIPFRCQDGQPLYLYGTVDIKTLQNLLVNQNYLPVKLGTSSGICTLAAVDYRDTNCGRYHEVIYGFLVSQEALSFPDDGSPMASLAAVSHPLVILMCYKLYLDDQFAIDVGREVYGFPKHSTPQAVEAGVIGPDFHFKLSCDGNLAFRGRITLPTQISPSVRSKMQTVTTQEVFQARITYDLEAAMGVHPIDSNDEFTISPESDLGRQLLDLKFQPKVAVYMPKAVFAMFKPGS